MRRNLAIAVVGIVACCAALLPATNALASNARLSMGGIETGIPQPSALCPTGSNVELSPFAGGAAGSITGDWSAGACHGNIPGTVSQSVPLLPGGYVTVNGVTRTGTTVLLQGAFGPTDGSITLVANTGSASSFNTQVFAISGPLTGGNLKDGQLSVTLTHYRFGTQTLEASLTGSATLTY